MIEEIKSNKSLSEENMELEIDESFVPEEEDESEEPDYFITRYSTIADRLEAINQNRRSQGGSLSFKVRPNSVSMLSVQYKTSKNYQPEHLDNQISQKCTHDIKQYECK